MAHIHVREGTDVSILIVVAHPDDEVLGCGATAALLASKGVEVHSCILSGGADARTLRPTDQELLDDINSAQHKMGIGDPILGAFPNIQLNTVSHLDLVQFIETAIERTNADVLFTHHPGDLNVDHQCTSAACQAAARLFQRRTGVPRLRGLHFMEVPSSSDWAFESVASRFSANTYVEIGEEYLQRKIEALRVYRKVMRGFPHPRSEEVLRGLAAYRGGQSGLRYAEAFQTVFRSLALEDGGL